METTAILIRVCHSTGSCLSLIAGYLAYIYVKGIKRKVGWKSFTVAAGMSVLNYMYSSDINWKTVMPFPLSDFPPDFTQYRGAVFMNSMGFGIRTCVI